MDAAQWIVVTEVVTWQPADRESYFRSTFGLRLFLAVLISRSNWRYQERLAEVAQEATKKLYRAHRHFDLLS